jgi:hypothetical protein
MVQKAVLATCIVALAWFVVVAKAAADGYDARRRAFERVQDCSVFYEPYRSRTFRRGFVSRRLLGFGAFEGALPQYPLNEFPNWYGLCATWGHYSASGKAR